MATPELREDPSFDELEEALEKMTLEELEHFCVRTLQICGFAQRQFKSRFPREWATFDRKVERGEITIT